MFLNRLLITGLFLFTTSSFSYEVDDFVNYTKENKSRIEKLLYKWCDKTEDELCLSHKCFLSGDVRVCNSYIRAEHSPDRTFYVFLMGCANTLKPFPCVALSLCNVDKGTCPIK